MAHARSLCLVLCIGFVALALPGCSSSGGEDGGGGSGGAPDALEDSLRNLGVDTTAEARVDPDQETLPDDYSPLGASASFGEPEQFSGNSGVNRTDELFMVNLDVAGSSERLTLVEQVGVQIDGDGQVDFGTTSVLHTMETDDNPWLDDTNGGGDSDDARGLRDVAAADVDADGLEEIVIVFVDTSGANRVVNIKVVEDKEDGFTETVETFAEGDEVLDVAIVGGDFDGDGADQVAVALTSAAGVELLVLTPRSGGNGEPASNYEVESEWTQTYDLALESPIATVEMASGNLDYDNPQELVLVVNEIISGPQGTSRYYVHDDGSTNLAPLDDGIVSGTDGQTYVARQADVSTGDVDGDGIDEILLAGLVEFFTSCDPYEAIVTALDDAKHGFSALSTKRFDAFFSNCPAFGPWRLRHVHVNAFDLDGDGIDEVQANQFIFDDLVAGGFSDPIHEMPQEIFVDRDNDSSVRISSGSTQIVTGDVTGDGRENIMTYAQWQGDVRIFGLSMIESVGFAELSRVDTTSNPNFQTDRGGILVPVNVDMDSPVLKYSAGEYELVFTEPVIIAVLAAAPCADDIGQNVDACAVAFGQTTSQTIDASVTVSVSAGVHVGVKTSANIPFVGDVGAEFKQSVRVTASVSAGVSYTVQKSRVFTTGPLEDGVVFTTIPYDQYTYRVLSHPDPDLVGGEVVVSLPREPLMLKVDRNFYNANITEAGTQIGSNVFDHSVGDLSSYPSASRKNSLLSEYGGLENGPISVGQGGGSDGLGIDVSTEISLGAELAIEVERSVDVTGGRVMAGYSVGYGLAASLTVSSGESTSYSVTVGDLSDEQFSDNQFSYGMFTYVQDDLPDEEFEVINFWVE